MVLSTRNGHSTCHRLVGSSPRDEASGCDFASDLTCGRVLGISQVDEEFIMLYLGLPTFSYHTNLLAPSGVGWRDLHPRGTEQSRTRLCILYSGGPSRKVIAAAYLLSDLIRKLVVQRRGNLLYTVIFSCSSCYPPRRMWAWTIFIVYDKNPGAALDYGDRMWAGGADWPMRLVTCTRRSCSATAFGCAPHRNMYVAPCCGSSKKYRRFSETL